MPGSGATPCPAPFLIEVSSYLQSDELSMNPERRTWDTPLRRPWNPVIKACLNAIDEHVSLFMATGDILHLEQAEHLRDYIVKLKDWILEQEGKTL